ncbi:hypothetical protein [Peribacillus sp. NPDC058075]|uniref:hypothetical protein n=1 Tax=unclassified Peribacillus TaxID=2675266 RepID=UPI0036D96352
MGIKWTDHLQRVAEYEVHEVDGHWENKSSEDSIYSLFGMMIGANISSLITYRIGLGAFESPSIPTNAW